MHSTQFSLHSFFLSNSSTAFSCVFEYLCLFLTSATGVCTGTTLALASQTSIVPCSKTSLHLSISAENWAKNVLKSVAIRKSKMLVKIEVVYMHYNKGGNSHASKVS